MRITTISRVLSVRSLAVAAAAGVLFIAGCGGGSDDSSGATTVVAEGDAGGSASPSAPDDDLLSYSSIRNAVDQKRVTEGDVTVVATSFCGEQVGNGVEVLAEGFPSGTIVEGEVNGQTIQLVETRPGVLTQIRIGTAETYEVVLTTPDGGTITTELAGCE